MGYAETASKCEETADRADTIWPECAGPLRRAAAALRAAAELDH